MGLWLGIWGYADFYRSVPIHFRILCPLTTFRTYFVFLACQEHKLEFLLPFDSRENHSRGTMSWAHHLRLKKRFPQRKKQIMFYRRIISTRQNPSKASPFVFCWNFYRVSPEYARRRWIRPNPRFTLYRVVNRAGHCLACSEEEALSAKQVKFNKKVFHGLWNERLIIINDYQLTGHKPLENWNSTEENWRTMSPRHTWKERGGLEFF